MTELCVSRATKKPVENWTPFLMTIFVELQIYGDKTRQDKTRCCLKLFQGRPEETSTYLRQGTDDRPKYFEKLQSST